MSHPRRVLPGVTYLFTRRCLERRFFLRPDEEVNRIVLYCLAYAAQRYGILVHAYCAMSNHLHLVITDPGARMPAFAQLMHSMIARAVNHELERWGYFWEAPTYSAVTLPGWWEQLEKSAYVLCNPVKAGLVQRGREWPGAWSAPERLGGPPLVITRPAFFGGELDEATPLPKQVKLYLVPPPGQPADRWREHLLRLTGWVEERKAAQLAEEGRRVAGRERVLAQSPEASAMSMEDRKRAYYAEFAARDKWRKLEFLQQVKQFRWDHRRAFKAYQAGKHQVRFPFGTYWMRAILNARCRAPG